MPVVKPATGCQVGIHRVVCDAMKTHTFVFFYISEENEQIRTKISATVAE